MISSVYAELRPVTSLGHQEGDEFSESGPNFLNYVQYYLILSNTFFQRVQNIFCGGIRLPCGPTLVTGLDALITVND